MLSNLKQNAVITVKVADKDLNDIKKLIDCCSNIIESRVLIQPSNDIQTSCIAELVTVDHREQFKQYVLDKLGASDVVVTELNRICEA